MQYNVTQTIQSNDLTNPPAEVKMYSGASLPSAMVAMAMAANDTDDDKSVPFKVRYHVLAVHLDITN